MQLDEVELEARGLQVVAAGEEEGQDTLLYTAGTAYGHLRQLHLDSCGINRPFLLLVSSCTLLQHPPLSPHAPPSPQPAWDSFTYRAGSHCSRSTYNGTSCNGLHSSPAAFCSRC